MNDLAPQKATSRRSADDSQANESSCKKFLQLRSDKSLTDEQFARAVFSFSEFREKQLLVARLLAGQWRTRSIDDAVQEAALSTYYLVAATRGAEFSGSTDDALGAWLFRLLRRHARWALAKIARAERRRRDRELLASRSESQELTSISEFAGAFEQVFLLIENLPGPVRIVALDLHYGVPVHQTAQACGLSERRVYELRAKVLSLVSDLLSELR